MSLFTAIIPGLSVKPHVSIDGPTLHARTNLLSQLFSGFSYCRHAHIDSMSRTVEVASRHLWLFTSSRTIDFDDIDHIDYDFASAGTSWGWTLGGYERTDQLEKYTVSLVLQSDEHVPLFNFYGEGSAHTGLEGVLLGGDTMLDVEGDQGGASLGFVEAIMQFTGKPLGRKLDIHLPDQKGDRWACENCDRPNPPNKKRCQYCGGRLVVTS